MPHSEQKLILGPQTSAEEQQHLGCEQEGVRGQGDS